jgi:hypothetical protein
MGEIINLEAVRYRRYCRTNGVVYARTLAAIRGAKPDAAMDALVDAMMQVLGETFDRDKARMHDAVAVIAEHLHRCIDTVDAQK